MTPENSAVNIYRREFLKSLPLHFAENLRRLVEARLITPIQTQFIAPDMAGIVNSVRAHAEVDVSLCLAWAGGQCQACYLACPLREEAIKVEDQKPIVFSSVCDGCGMCLTACGTVTDQVAIRIRSATSIRTGNS